MQVNCPKIRQMIKNHPWLFAKILVTIENKDIRYWHDQCIINEIEMMATLVNYLIDNNIQKDIN